MDKYIEYYTAPWCGPCRVMEPLVKALAERRKLPLREYNVDISKEKATERGVRAVPTALLCQDDAVLKRVIGIIPKKQLTQEL